MAEETFTDHILKNETFHKLDPPDQVEFLKQQDPEFGKLKMSQQFHIINDAKQKMNPIVPEQTGFDKSTGEQLGDFAVQAGKNIIGAPVAAYNMLRHPLNAAMDLYQGQKDQFDKAQDQPGQAPIPLAEKVGRYAAAALPVLGPMAAQAGEDIGKGNFGTGLANGMTALTMGTSGGRGMVSDVVANTVGKTPIGKVARAGKAAGGALLDQYTPGVVKAAKDAYSNVPIDDKVKEFEATRKVSRPAKTTGPGRTTDDLNKAEEPEFKSGSGKIDSGRMVKRGTTTEDLNPVEKPEFKSGEGKIDKGRMVKRTTSPDDFKDKYSVGDGAINKSIISKVEGAKREVSPPSAPVDRSIIGRVERAKKLKQPEDQ